MINLIPNQEKHRKVKDFYFKLAVVFCVTSGLSIVVASVAILPAYFLSSVNKNLISTRLEVQKNAPVSSDDQEIITAAGKLEQQLKLIENTGGDAFVISETVVNGILLKKMNDIKITGISYEVSTTKGRVVTVNGSAPSRERLLLFRKALEDDVAFQTVDLPISNFIKGSNIEFSLQLTPA